MNIYSNIQDKRWQHVLIHVCVYLCFLAFLPTVAFYFLDLLAGLYYRIRRTIHTDKTRWKHLFVFVRVGDKFKA